MSFFDIGEQIYFHYSNLLNAMLSGNAASVFDGDSG